MVLDLHTYLTRQIANSGCFVIVSNPNTGNITNIVMYLRAVRV